VEFKQTNILELGSKRNMGINSLATFATSYGKVKKTAVFRWFRFFCYLTDLLFRGKFFGKRLRPASGYYHNLSYFFNTLQNNII
jgi:hypothetical protein